MTIDGVCHEAVWTGFCLVVTGPSSSSPRVPQSATVENRKWVFLCTEVSGEIGRWEEGRGVFWPHSVLTLTLQSSLPEKSSSEMPGMGCRAPDLWEDGAACRAGVK